MVIKVTCTQLIKKTEKWVGIFSFLFCCPEYDSDRNKLKKKANYVHTCKYLGELVAGVLKSHGLIQGVSIPLFFQYPRSFE